MVYKKLIREELIALSQSSEVMNWLLYCEYMASGLMSAYALRHQQKFYLTFQEEYKVN